MKLKAITAAASAALLATVALPALADVTVTVEAPGIQNSTVSFAESGVETFDSLTLGIQNFTSDFGGSSSFSGQYNNVYVQGPNAWGGAGNSDYATADGNLATGGTSHIYTLQLLNDNSANYFGFYLMALSSGNQLEFFSGDTRVAVYDEGAFDSLLSSAYVGSPDSGQTSGEKFAFLNFNFTDGDTYDRVVFSNFGGDGFETDNHTVGMLAPVPEPGTWALLLGGLGLVGFMARRRLAPEGQDPMAA